MDASKRALMGAMAAGAAQLLWTQRVSAQSVLGNTAPPGLIDVQLSTLSSGVLRISIAPAHNQVQTYELAVVEDGWSAPLGKPGHEFPQTLNWGKYTVRVEGGPLKVGVYENGKLRQEVRIVGDTANVAFSLDGPIYGLGEGSHPYDLRGTTDRMISGSHSPDLSTYGARVPFPWLISPKGWGVFIGQPSGTFDISQTEAVFRTTEASATRNIYLLVGDGPADVLTQFAHLTGQPHLPPLWSLGYQQSHRTLASREEVMGITTTFREKKLPCDAVIYLGTGYTPGGWNTGHGSFIFNEKVFPDPEAMFRQMHDNHFKVVLHAVPPGNLHGTLADTGAQAEEPGSAVRYWPLHIPVLQTGVDGWWPDEGDRLSVYARYERNRLYWDGMRQYAPDKRPFALHRNGYAGMQRYGWLWSGDVSSSWATLRIQIMVGIVTGLSGIPYWGTDIGGFWATAEYSPEMFARWFQFGAFCPSFRSHGRAWKLHLPWGWNLGSAEPKEHGQSSWIATWPREEDMHRADIEDICRKYLNLRYQLMPYLYATTAQCHETGLPIIRALWLHYPDDAKALTIEDAYMWGDHMLVAPVCEKDAATREVYLPAGQWWDYWTQTPVAGGQTLTVATPLDHMPLYVRAGAILPTGPVRQYVDEPVDEPVTLRVYPGASGRFSWYDDAGDGFGYERGEFMKIDCGWDDARRVLTLTPDPSGRQGVGRKVRVALAGSKRSKSITLKAGVLEVPLK